MADYWKSNPRKFCEVCKCWFGDNKISIDFHESGRRHQENVKKQLRQARAKHVENEKDQQKTAKMLAAIEQAAIQAYEKDLAVAYGEASVQEASRAKIAQQVNGQEGPETPASVALQRQQQLQQEQDEIKQKIQENIEKKVKELKKKKEQQPTWQQFTSPEGYTYYYNTATGVSQWEVPADYDHQQSSSQTLQQPHPYTPAATGDGSEREEETSVHKSSSTAAGQKRGAGQAGVEPRDTHQPPKRNANPYGAWTTVSVAEREDEGTEELSKEDHKKDEGSSDEEEGAQDDVMQIREKTLSGLNDGENLSTSSEGRTGFKSFSFKKRTGGRPQIRQRTSDI